MTRIALIHALAHSVDPINEELKRAWPECQRMNLLDDSLSADLAASGKGLDDAMTERFIKLADYAVTTGADAILFTCSAFGPCIEAVARRHASLPVLKPNEAMIADAVATGQPIGLIASFGPTLASMPPEFPAATKVRPCLVEGAMDALNRGDTATHDRLVVAAAQRLVDEGCTVIALAQFSLARTREAVARQTGAQVLTTVQSAVRALRSRLMQPT
jgi:Asp/Glu/hydantoin racemase